MTTSDTWLLFAVITVFALFVYVSWRYAEKHAPQPGSDSDSPVSGGPREQDPVPGDGAVPIALGTVILLVSGVGAALTTHPANILGALAGFAFLVWGLRRFARGIVGGLSRDAK